MSSATRLLGIMLVGLFLSGTAGIINQVAWQRGLKIFLGGSEALSALVVVLVFMLGLGVGSGVMAKFISRVKRPIAWLAGVEALLALATVGIAALLRLDISETVYLAQRGAQANGIPIRFLYGVAAFLVLIAPTFLMGTTLPLASDACQRTLGYTKSSLITVLFFLNCMGAALGAFGCSLYLMPYHGAFVSMLYAAGCNAVAAVAFLALDRIAQQRPAPEVGARPEPSPRPPGLSLEETLGFVLGFLALGYEMYLLRLMSLTQTPQPFTFALTLCFYLLFWSTGVFLSSRFKEVLPVHLIVGAVLIAAMPAIYAFDRVSGHFAIVGGSLVYFLPCLSFGFLYGSLVSRFQRRWGEDVGRFYALNTAGSGLGILFFTLVGYELDLDVDAALIALGMVATLLYLLRIEAPARLEILKRPFVSNAAVGLSVATMVVLTVVGVRATWTRGLGNSWTFWGRDGVIEVLPNGDMIWDGLWHSKLSNQNDHLGTNNWLLAVAPVLAHNDEPITDGLVIGLGTGVTSATLAKVEGIAVDTYDINEKLADVLEKFPAGTLNVGTLPNSRLIWQDGRSGLALNEKKYDVITQQPLYLKQAGSTLLLSREYMQLVQSRLKPGGTYTIYSNAEGNEEQALLVFRTAQAVFKYCETWGAGYAVIASDSPMDLRWETIRERLGRHGPLGRELAFVYENPAGQKLLEGLFDTDVERAPEGTFIITDDHPLVEYPRIIEKLAKEVPF